MPAAAMKIEEEGVKADSVAFSQMDFSQSWIDWTKLQFYCPLPLNAGPKNSTVSFFMWQSCSSDGFISSALVK